MRARAFLAEAMSVPPEAVDVPVIGGHAGDTILPLLSQATPPFAFTDAEVAALTTRIQNAGTEARDARMPAACECARGTMLTAPDTHATHTCSAPRAGCGSQSGRGQRHAQHGGCRGGVR
jgi:hypothetical protein